HAAAETTGGQASGGSSETGRHRTYKITYPSTRPPTSVIETSVLLEMGVRGGADPHESMPITSLLGETLSATIADSRRYDDLTIFNIEVLHPARTLLEKLDNVHGIALQLVDDPDHDVPYRSGRHFYDIYELLATDRVLKWLQDRDQMLVVVNNIAEISQRYFVGTTTTTRPHDGYGASPVFDPTSAASAKAKRAYESTMPELYFGTGELPTWDQILERIANHAGLL
ncbi:MAG: nucleotidyl transferase AbiEii/AbiGii toxin family protein, partial [Microthrixaceae bacterium]|nr:nucleotidyl transferase AbiEii/AbiGii toxin family protein [Microthrixaceae bacterium]